MRYLRSVGLITATAAFVVAAAASAQDQSSIVPVGSEGGLPIVQFERLRDMAVVGSNGERLGTLAEVLVDLGGNHAPYAAVTPARTGTGRTVVPFDMLTLAYDPGTIRAQVVAQGDDAGKPLARIQASELIDRDVYNENGDEISEVEEVVVIDGQPGSFIVLEVGGFLGLGEKEVALPLSEFAMIDDQLVLKASVTEDDMTKAPAFDPEKGTAVESSEVVSSVNDLESTGAEKLDLEDGKFLDDTVLALRLTEQEFAKAPQLESDGGVWPNTDLAKKVSDFYGSMTSGRK